MFFVYDVLYINNLCSYMVFFLFKQKTAYEMRISDWSSDVCSSDLRISGMDFAPKPRKNAAAFRGAAAYGSPRAPLFGCGFYGQRASRSGEIGRASCRERVCQYV